MSSTETPTIVTLVVVFDKKQPESTVRIRMAEELAQRAVVHSTSGMCVSRPFSGYDAAGQPFNINVGDMALAVYIETEAPSNGS